MLILYIISLGDVFMYKVEITSLNHQGMGVGKIGDKVIFVSDALIGEIVDVEIIRDYKKYMVGRVIGFEKRSPSRCSYDCAYYGRCGGCNIATLSYPMQLEFKKNKVIDIFRKYGGIDINPVIVAGDAFGYRNKVIIHAKNGKIGFYERDTNTIVAIDRCLVANETINKIVSKVSGNLDLTLVDKIMVRTGYGESMVVVDGEIDIDELIDILSFVDVIYVNNELVYGKDKIIEKLGDYFFYISPNSFFQVNTKQAYNLYNQVLEYASLDKGMNVLDLYCGTGTIGMFLSKYCALVQGIEINESAVRDANLNKELNGVDNISFICGKSSLISKMENKFDVVVVDPPRGGLDKQTVDTLLKNRVKRIVYVSCDPMTLVRDVKMLEEVYQLSDIKLFDMFAESYHVESVVLLVNKDALK